MAAMFSGIGTLLSGLASVITALTALRLARRPNTSSEPPSTDPRQNEDPPRNADTPRIDPPSDDSPSGRDGYL
jgi:hypothetical protein